MPHENAALWRAVADRRTPVGAEQVGELKTQFEKKTGLTPEMARVPALAVAKNVSLGDYLVRDEAERMRVDGE